LAPPGEDFSLQPTVVAQTKATTESNAISFFMV
jgi:hypothetical protein